MEHKEIEKLCLKIIYPEFHDRLIKIIINR